MNTFKKLVFKSRLMLARPRFAGTWPVTCVDVSMWQNYIDWTQVPDDVAIIKATEADNWVDTRFSENWQNARAAGKRRSAYHFFRPGVAVQGQIDNFCNTVGQWEAGDLPPMLDLEVPDEWASLSSDQCVDLIAQWCDGVEQRLGARPYLYGSTSFFNQTLNNDPRLAKYQLDVANWTTADGPMVPAPWNTWTFWQWTDGTNPPANLVPGISGSVDQDRFNGTDADLQKLGFGYTPFVTRILIALGLVKKQPLPCRLPENWIATTIQPEFDPSVIIQHPSPNSESRGGQSVTFLIEHYTVDSKEDALARLCDPVAEVSSHYVVDEEGTIYQLVDESLQAWHAGTSYWDGYTAINPVSIGIEIVNPGDAPYTAPQMEAVKALSLWIAQRYNIPATHVLGHSDVALTTANHKSDPGWFFNWNSLALVGVGVWPQPTQADYDRSAGWSDADFIFNLSNYGYSVNADLPVLVEAFQRHFQPEVAQAPDNVGIIDALTRARLACLLRFKATNVSLF